MPNLRMRRVDELLHQELSKIIAYELSDPRIGPVTVTRVRTTNDLRTATVYVAVSSEDPEEVEETLQGLAAARGYIKRLLASRIALKRLPDPQFEQDDVFAKANRIDELLHEIEQEARAPDPEDDPAPDNA